MRVMAIDYGDARIGLAVSDLTGLICGEAWTMQEWNMERAKDLIHSCGRVIVAMPRIGENNVKLRELIDSIPKEKREDI